MGKNLGVDDMLPEYDFQGGVRGKHHETYRIGHTVKVHQADGTTSTHYFPLKDGAVVLDPAKPVPEQRET